MPTCLSSVSDRESQASLVTKLTKSYYQDDQQAKFMHLQAEVDSLLQQLESLKHQRLAATSQKE
ncbi:MAG: hypothetical protein RMY36_023840 [Nostoc sp. SerVER01]|uniref:hypothetical protein n=1 Tax=Nostoc sp. CCY 9925 TaxID=3103865 RepID=UPI002AD8A8F2|nr:hypothetical protein [Nostoc sp. SerVER01]MDZ8023117.1 hypothetical protein [Nostoc sp. DedQUE11]MDZ8071559.1 hypothetical protein [Nostoc sp. DedQUE01]MDZ8080881.1 hypothetical protein [Nostoc sp. DcaGUA01]